MSPRASSNRRGTLLFPGCPGPCGGGAILDYREVAGHSIHAPFKRIRFAGFTGRGGRGFKESIVELGVVREESGCPEASFAIFWEEAM